MALQQKVAEFSVYHFAAVLYQFFSQGVKDWAFDVKQDWVRKRLQNVTFLADRMSQMGLDSEAVLKWFFWKFIS